MKAGVHILIRHAGLYALVAYLWPLHLICQTTLTAAPHDTLIVKKFLDQSQQYYFSQPDSSLFYSQKALDLARKINDVSLQARALNSTGESYRFLGDYPNSIRSQFTALDIYRQRGDGPNQALTGIFIGFSHQEMGDYRHALEYLLPARQYMEGRGDRFFDCFSSSLIGYTYLMLGQIDSAMLYSQRAYDSLKNDYVAALRSLVISRLGKVYEVKGQPDVALRLYHASLLNAQQRNTPVIVIRISNYLAELHAQLGHSDSALYYARTTIAGSRGNGQRPQVLSAAALLADIFRKRGNIDSAYFYQSMAMALKDSLYGADQFRDLQVLTLEEQRKQQELVEAQKAQRNLFLFIILGIIAAALALLAWIQYRNSRQKSEANHMLSAQKTQIEKTLQELKLAQAQLIQSEKMASLGEMTAGIAHEIQNPLNFVNNFSDLNTELIDELRAAIKTGERELALHLTRDIQSNQDKISAHGKKADAIVKSMLQHSRSSSGQRELTDVNKLAEEYLKLAFRGMRGKDKSFNVTLQTNYDPAVGSVSVNAHDIGRALLNLLNNAFYAVQMKKQKEGKGYEPLVRIRTGRIRKTVQVGDTSTEKEFIEIRLEDNGPGIPQQHLGKVFQPFFTTKPTGEGTGLGLSLSYDIAKSHGGDITVSSREGEGATFSMIIPA